MTGSSASPGVVFLFSDIEGSTRLWEEQPGPMATALARHDAAAREAVAAWRGTLVKGTGDGIHAAFADAADALAATLQLQRALAAEAEAGTLPLQVRCGLHAGPGEARDNDFFGPEVNRAARVMAVAHGGQVLVSQPVADQLAGRLPNGVALKDLGLARLKDLLRPERLWQVVAPPLRSDFPPLRGLQATPHNLTQPLNRFIGREAVLPALKDLLGTHRLVTLFGTGGLGKSRLALELGVSLLDEHPDGVWFIELAPLTDGRQVPQAVAAVLGVKEEPGRPIDQALCRHVAGRRLLLVLDNCEHVLADAAALAKALLQAGGGLRLLATSREVLRVAGELSYPVPALSVPAPGAVPADPQALLAHDAVRLFTDRAASAQPGFMLTPANAAVVAEICHRLDGIPLALELAAARVRALPLPVLATRLRDSLQLLATQDATVAPRQRTLRLLIDWSHDLLGAPERLLFRRLSVFAGGCSLEAAEAVCAGDGLAGDEVLDLLGQLVEKSLLGLDAERGRWRMLETMRQHAADKLRQAPDDATPQRHLDWCLALAEQARPQLAGPAQAGWLARLDDERDNLLAAHAWAVSAAPDAQAGLRMSFALRPYWLHRGLPTPGLEMTTAALAYRRDAAPPMLRARGLFDAGQLCSFMGRYAEARTHLEESLQLLRAGGDSARVASVLQPLGMAAVGLGDLALAGRCFDEALQIARAGGQPRPLAAALNAQAQLLRLRGELDPAQALYAEALALLRQAGDAEGAAVTLLNLAMVALARPDLPAVRPLVAEAWQAMAGGDSQPLALGLLDVCTGLAVLAGDDARAADHHGAAQALLARTGLQRDGVDQAFLEPMLGAARARCGAAAWDAAVAAAGQRPWDDQLAALPAWLDGSSAGLTSR